MKLFNRLFASAAALAAVLAAGLAFAQSSVSAKPPQAQAWIDVATFSGISMPGMGGGGSTNPMAALGSLFGGIGSLKNTFGHTADGTSGRWVDVTLMTRANPALTEAAQAVPASFFNAALKLQSPPNAQPPQPETAEGTLEHDVERPKGRLVLYWGCGAAVRAGQPKVLDMASASTADLARFFVSRRATQRGAHGASGRPVWPSPADARMLPEQASLAGAHTFTGAGVPEGFRFQIPQAQDVMPPLQLQQTDQGGATELSWRALPTARAYFIAGIGASKGDEMVLWTSSELPDTGFGLLDYQTNVAVDRWLREKVLLGAATTQCTIPKGVFSDEGAMLRAIAYGSELNLAHPPRPADPKASWEPVWAAKVRVKSVASAVLGMPGVSMPGAPPGVEDGNKKTEDKVPKVLDLLRGMLGR